jgi:hypothetical protein
MCNVCTLLLCQYFPFGNMTSGSQRLLSLDRLVITKDILCRTLRGRFFIYGRPPQFPMDLNKSDGVPLVLLYD